jgi:GNAT superfamily N-acetyltransferase
VARVVEGGADDAQAVLIRQLARDDDRSDFSCGQADLDRFFEHYAGVNQFKLHLAVTYVALVRGSIVGFATVAPTAIERASVPSARLRKRLPHYPLPVLRLARLGVDRRAQGLGIGKALLRQVLCLAVEQRERLGCVGVVTDAKPEAREFYERLGFEALEQVREGLLLSSPSPMFLSLETIVRALEV